MDRRLNVAFYEHLIDQADDLYVIDSLRWIREREAVRFQRFGEILNMLFEWKDSKNIFESTRPARAGLFF